MPIAFNSLCPLLQVFDMPASLRFYRNILGFEIAASDRSGDDCDWCLLRHGRAELMLNTQYEREERPPAPNPARRNAHRDTSLYLDCPDLDAALEHFRAHGITAEGPVTRDYGMRQLTVDDPDGYVVCFQTAVR